MNKLFHLGPCDTIFNSEDKLQVTLFNFLTRERSLEVGNYTNSPML